jgi:hypothetical protein
MTGKEDGGTRQVKGKRWQEKTLERIWKGHN